MRPGTSPAAATLVACLVALAVPAAARAQNAPPGVGAEDLARLTDELASEIVSLKELPRPRAGGRTPLTIGGLVDETSEGVDLNALSDRLGAAIDASSRLRVVLAGEPDAENAALGVTGAISSRLERADRGGYRVTYELRLTMVALATREIVWTGRRFVHRPGRWEPDAPDGLEVGPEDHLALIEPQIDALARADGLPGGRAAPPRLLVERVRNRSSEHVDVAALGRRLVAGLIDARRFRVFSVDDRLVDLLREPGRSLPTDEVVRTRADLVLLGDLTGNRQRSAETSRARYTLTLSLVDRASGELLWMGQESLRKPPHITPPPGLELHVTDLPSLVDPVITRLVARDDLTKGADAGERPTLRIAALRNRTSQHLDMGAVAPRVLMGLLRGRRFRLLLPDADGGDEPATALALEGELTADLADGPRGREATYRLTLRLRDVGADREVWKDTGTLSKVVR